MVRARVSRFICALVLLALAGGGARACRTAADVLAQELPAFKLSAVFQRIYGSPDLKGLMLIPTEEAWEGLGPLAAMQNVDLKGAGPRGGRRGAARRGAAHGAADGDNLTATALSGGLALYWLAQGSKIDPGALPMGGSPTKLATEARWRCSLPEKRGSVGHGMRLSRGEGGVLIEHGGSAVRDGPVLARLAEPAEPLKGTCPGLTIYKVDAVPLPCSSLAAIAAEANNPSQAGCTRHADASVSHALLAGGSGQFLQLLAASGLLPAVDKTAAPFTVLAPSDAAVEAAAAAGAFDYGSLFATNKTRLRQLVGYHVASGQALAQPTRRSAEGLAPTLMEGGASCGAAGAPAWGADGLVRSARGVARAGAAVEACHSTVVPIDALLLPCCAPIDKLLAGRGGGAPAGSGGPAAQQLQKLLRLVADRMKQAPSNSTQIAIIPTHAAWAEFTRVNGPVDDALLGALSQMLVSSHLGGGGDVSKVMADPQERISLNGKLPDSAAQKLCPAGGDFSLSLAVAAPAPLPAARRLLAGGDAPPAAAPGLAGCDPPAGGAAANSGAAGSGDAGGTERNGAGGAARAAALAAALAVAAATLAAL
ncbi:MAG: hypothetical protein J3K34DRAFT_524238 [Monoraphidium minutum]|nr:MAG: hypothetical protein J3K34DRAFT_524238 [Monoraphidium minutum]